ncbi:MAG: thioredoxin family protein [Bacteroidales bacterium]|jgi:thioredoxin-like negative regulator of GroEL
MIHEIKSQQEFDELLQNEAAVLLYFSHEECNVCKVLKPKIADLLRAKFPAIKMCYINIKKFPEIAGQQRVFTVPTLTVCFEGKEYLRKSRNVSLQVLAEELDRPYSLFFAQ